jgi:CBS domain-containing membrane protein
LPNTARFKPFVPILAGATLRDRLLACGGALIGIVVTGFLCGLAAGNAPHLLLLVPPMGASAVLVFAVPSSPMAQPWPTIGGNTISALVGIAVGHTITEPALAAGVAVGIAIGAMSLLRCLHPPGGAAALVAVFASSSAGYLFPLVPVGLNAAVLVLCGLAYHRLSGHSYPHVAKPAAPQPAPPTMPVVPSFQREDVAAALDEMGEAFDISVEDLERLLGEIEKRAQARAQGDLSYID